MREQSASPTTPLGSSMCLENLGLINPKSHVIHLQDEINVPTPRRFTSQADDIPQLSQDLIEFVDEQFGLDFSPAGFPKQSVTQLDKDTIELNGQTMKKPFVEKPASGEDHNINIYYHSSSGGGGRRLFRKVFDLHLFQTFICEDCQQIERFRS